MAQHSGYSILGLIMATNKSMVLPFCKKIVQPFRWQIISMLLICVVWAANVSVRPYFIKKIIDKSSSFPQNEGNIWYLLLPILGYLSMVLLMGASCRLYEIIDLKTFPKLKRAVMNSLMHSMMHNSFLFYQKNLTGSLVNKVNNVVDGIPEIIEMFISRFFVQILSLIIAAYTLWQVAPKFSLIMVVWSTIFISVSIITSKKASNLSKHTSEVRSTISGKIADITANMSSVRLFTACSHENYLLNENLNKSVNVEQKFKWFFFKIGFFQCLSFFVLEIICLYLLLIERRSGLVTTGDFALILTMNFSITGLIFSVFKDFTKFFRILGQTTQGLSIIKSKPEVFDIPSAKELTVEEGVISFEKVCFNHQGMETLFSNKSIVINARQKVGIVGYSGSGKTTFVNLILRLFEIQSGNIIIDGQKISDITQESLWKAIAVYPQDLFLFHRSLMENIRYGNLQASDEEVIKAAKLAFAHEFITSFPQQYETLVGERGVKLSTGQRQRIAIARAILKNAPILILDEATSSLDSVTESCIQKSLWKLMENKTAIVIAHRLSTLLHMDRILVFEKGKILEDGTHHELINNNGLYKTMWDAQKEGFLP